MVLADTSVWVDHFRQGNALLEQLLEQERVFMHPHVLGELVCGNLSQRLFTIDWLRRLPVVRTAYDAEVRAMVEREKLYGRGLGWVDAHILAAARLESTPLLTLDRALAAAAAAVGLEFRPD